MEFSSLHNEIRPEIKHHQTRKSASILSFRTRNRKKGRTAGHYELITARQHRKRLVCENYASASELG